ncbi:MAG: polyprenol monophosphomannose synthase [Lewinellaceae bacterium]|nr:polyprenol monophosphomannose synthase [Saprospiraceae bacterium]MCB9333413.1 polyprenol monophosphomannose synthase [Lewinellaceae bacterium]
MPNLVIIPTYNERENVEAIIRAVCTLPESFHVLIVDDGSPDGTADIVRDLQQHTFPEQVHLLERSGKLGLGTAYIAGFRWGLERGYTYLFEMDADFSHNPQDLPRLLAKCRDEGADVAVGSRYVRSGHVENWPVDRIILSYGASLYTRLILWMPVADPTAGFICYRREVLEIIDLDRIRFVGYAFQIAMKFSAYSLGFKVREVPITFKDREKGQSKMSLHIIREAIFGVLQLRWQTLFKSFRKGN